MIRKLNKSVSLLMDMHHCYKYNSHSMNTNQPNIVVIFRRSFIMSRSNLTSKKDDVSGMIPHASYIESITKSHVAVTLKDLEDSLIKRYLRGYTRFQTRLALTLLSLVGFSSLTIYMFREPIKENLSDEVADVASRSLGDESVILKANEISRIVIHDVINDPNTQTVVSNFVLELLKKEVVQQAAIDLVKFVVNNKEIQQQVNELIVQALKNLLENDETRILLLTYIKSLLLDPQTNEGCQWLLKNLADDEYTKEILAECFKNVMASDTVTIQAVTLGKNVTQDIIKDESIQKETGNALWNAGCYSITPRWFAK